MIEYNWSITKMKVITDPTNEIDNYVHQIFYCLNGKDLATDRIESVCGDLMFAVNKIDNFVAFEDLTEEIVSEWIESSLGENAIISFKLDIEKRLRIEENIVTPPWATDQET
jgi:hypothetical protein